MKDLITASIMKGACLEVLLKSEKEEELVCLCKLFQTVGAKLEKYHLDRSKQKKYKAQNMQDVFPAYFEQITVIGNAHPSSRVRFMMKDLVEMRSNDWTARREEDKMINLDKKNAAADFAPVQTAYVSGDARQNDAFAAAPVDEWSVVPAGGNKKRPPTSGAPSPVPGGNISRTNSNAQISRSNSTSNNLGSQDRRGPRAPGPSGPAIAAPLKKEKSAGKPEGSRGPAKDASKQPRGPRGSSASPVPNGDKEDEGDAAETAAAPAEAASYGTDLGEIQKRVRSAMKEFYANVLLEEPTLTFQELRPSPELMSDIVKVR
jgi:translation initiation factor 4G